ncbi:spindle assembly checkpoint component MAD1 [Purpureocillium lavendulum]|uniref:Spindle assembly checkpoint component MAD1 n=1 Tax=Purpureocillium lavendulum TaxID=1247861 RepID=A0AB34G8R2_9HYPO|nr:spindle assembly checkpoint component MAD1 [Purpureocillium lavendulum]
MPHRAARVATVVDVTMRSHTPHEGERGGRRVSASSRLRASTSALPRPQTNLRESRGPTYNLITGAEPNSRPSSRQSYAAESVRPGSRESSKENMAPPDADEYEKYRKEIESLKAEIGTLQYRMQTAEQEKDIALSQQANKLEQARRREQDEAQQRQLAEAERAQAADQAEAVRRELEELRETAVAEQKSLDRKAREAQDEARLLQEQLDDLSAAKDEAARIADKKMADLQMQITASQNSIRELEQEAQTKDEALQHAQGQLADRDSQIAGLEADVLRLKAQSGDAETMDIIKRELSEQVQHIRALEATNRDQLSELKHLRSVNKAVEIVEEEKRTLQRRLEAAETLEAELAEARLQRQRLQDERLAWTAYLQNASETGDDEFDSPEAMARALVQERLTTASYVDQLGALRAEMTAQENTTQSLQEERMQLKEQLEAAKTAASASSTDKARLRLDRQRALALKEVEYLRAQLKAIDEEDHTMQPAQHDEARAARIQELEKIVDDYKTEVQTLHAALSSQEPSAGTPTTPATPAAAGTKRSRPDDDGGNGDDNGDAQERLGQLTRKNRKLQDELTGLQTKASLLERDLAASREQLSAAKEHNQTRILSLRSNPTSDYEAIKRSTLEALQSENKHLLANLRARHPDPSVPVIPTSVLGAMEREVAAAKAETASAKKSAQRLKEVWGSKSHEFKEAIFSTLGWTVTFIPNGKMRVESTFYPSRTDEHENSIVFDGERGTMKVGGGPRSAFARRIGDQIGFWVREKGCIPGFLAALTLEFYEEHNNNNANAAAAAAVGGGA